MNATKRMLDECAPPPKPATQVSPEGNVTAWKVRPLPGWLPCSDWCRAVTGAVQ